MRDLDIAKSRLFKKNETLVVVSKGRVLFETDSHRISGFLRAIEQLGAQLEGAAVADRVAGKAVAFLCAYARISEVYARVLSRKAKAILEEKGILSEWNVLVDNILNLNRSDVCPFEKAAVEISDPANAYSTFKAMQSFSKTS